MRVQMGDIVRVFADALWATTALTSAQYEALVALARCRTAVLGGHTTPVYHSCRNRHCSRCQGLDQHRGLGARRERILLTRWVSVGVPEPGENRATSTS